MERTRKSAADLDGVAARPALSLDTLRGQLAIDTDALDACLEEQPDLYWHVSEQYADAVARRDAAKLTLEQVMAELDEKFRSAAAAADQKITETALQRKLATSPRIQELERKLLELRADADKWQALKEAFQQRSFMLRELVAMLIARMGNLSLERGMRGVQGDLNDARVARVAEARRQRSESRR